jgi:hypothetical protein
LETNGVVGVEERTELRLESRMEGRSLGGVQIVENRIEFRDAISVIERSRLH